MKIISRRTFFIALLVVCLIDMIQAGFLEEIKDAIHYDNVKKFTKDAVQKTGEAATSAFHSVKDLFTGATTDSTTTSPIKPSPN